MPSKTQHKLQFARERGVSVYHIRFPASIPQFTSGWYIGCEQGELGPYLSKRAAKNEAYRIAVGQKPLYIGVKRK